MGGRGAAAAADVRGGTTTRRRVYFLLFLGWVALTFTLTSIPNPDFDVGIPHADKLAHMGFYAVMAFFCALWRRESGATPGLAILIAVLIISAAGAVDEAHQLLIPGRSMDFRDWIFDAVGGFLGAGSAMFLPVVMPFLLTE